MKTQEYSLLIGTYGKQTSRHLYHCLLNAQTGQLSQLEELAPAQQSSYLAQDNQGNFFSLLRTGEKAGLTLFSKTGQVLSQILEEPIPACHLSHFSDKNQAYTANYHTGEVLAYQIDKSGQLILTNRLKLGAGSQPHFVGQTPDGLVIISLMGQDRLVCYKMTTETWTPISQFDLPAGTRPRHLTFHPQRKAVYVVGEADNLVHTLFYDGYGAFEHYQSLSTLPEGTTCDSWAGAIRLSPDSRFLYVSNRGHDSIVRFRVEADGSLSSGQWLALGAKNPRDLVLTAQGDWLLAACLDSNLVLSLAIDPENGTLRPCDQLEINEPVSLLVQNP